MKKLYTKLAGSDLKFSHFPLIKVLTLTSIAALLSSISPALSKDRDSREGISANIRNTAGIYPQSVISVYDESRSNLGSFNGSKNDYIRMLNTALTSQVNALSDYKNFLTRTLTGVGNNNSIANTLKIDGNKLSKNTLSSEDQYKKFIVDPQFFIDSSSVTQSFTQNGQDTVTIDASDFSRKDHIESMTRSGEVERDVSGSNVIFGEDVEAKTTDSVVIGSKAKAVLAEGDKKLAASVIIGSKSEIHRGGSVAVGADIVALKNDAVAVGRFVRVEEGDGTALGFKTQVKVAGGVALGSNSVADRAAGEFGYAPSVKSEVAASDKAQWKSTEGAVSVGDLNKGLTRQIVGVAAGKGATDAVNVTQLVDMKRFVTENGWKLSVGGENGKTVLIDDEVDFSAGSSNLKITKGKDDNNVKFDLAQDVTLTSLKAGTNTFDATGLVITDGPKITTGGIDAGNKKITGIAPGDLSADSQDAVNGSQLNVVATHIARYLGGGVKFTNGQWDDPTFKIKTFNPEKNEIEEESFPDVAKAFEGVGKSYVNLHNEIKKAADGSVFKWHAETESITIAASEGKGGQGSIAIGKLSSAFGENSIALGGFSAASAENSIALGGFSAASAENSMALGGLSSASGENSIALGSNAQVNGGVTGGVAVGYKSFSRNSASIVGYDPFIGSKSTDDDVIWKSTQGAFSIGDTPNKITRQLTGVAAGYADTDAVNVAQLKKLREFVAQGWTLSLNDEAVSDFQPGDKLNLASGSDNLKIKSSDKKDSISKEITFDLAQDVTLNSVKLKDVTLDTTGLTIENGPKIAANGIEAGNKKITGLAGGDLNANSTDAVSGSQLFETNDKVATYLGGGASYEGGAWTGPTFKVTTIQDDGNSEDKKYDTVAEALEGVGSSITNVKNEITKEIADAKSDSLNWSESDNAFVATHGENKDSSKLTFLKNGEITATSTDAVAGNQLHALGSSVATYLGGGASYEGGAWTGPTFKVTTIQDDGNSEDKKYDTVAEALEGVGSSITNVKNEITKEIADAKSDSLNWSESDNAFVATHGENKDSSKLTFLKNGEITATSTDAVAGNQLHALGSSVATYLGGGASYEGGAWTGPNFTLKTFTADGKEGGSKDYPDVAQAFAGINDNFQNVNTNVQNIVKDFNEKVTNITQEVQGDALLWDKTTGAFVATHGEENSKTKSKITSLADGSVVVGSSDAVTGGQINTIAVSLAKILGGKTSFSADGTFTVPSYDLSIVSKEGNVTDKSYEGVETAFKGLDDNIKNVNARIKEVSEGVAQDSLSWSKAEGAFVAQHEKEGKKENSKIKFLAAGDITKESTDAVNGSQLHGLGDKVATYFGGGASYENGQWTAPTFKVKIVNEDGTKVEDKDYSSVSAAFEGVGASFTNIHNEITKNTTEVTENIKQNALMWNEKEGAFVATHGKEDAKSNSKIKYLANGDISVDSTDAVSGGQLRTITDDLSKILGGEVSFDGKNFQGPKYDLSHIAEDGAVTEKLHTDVGSAFKGLDDNIKNVNARIKEVSEGVAQDSLSWSKDAGAFVAQHGEKDGEKTNSKITSLADGTIASGSSDAVTGGQIYSLGDKVAKYFSDDAEYKDGELRVPDFKLKTINDDGTEAESSYKNVSDAFSGVGELFTKVQNAISDVISNLLVTKNEDVINVGKGVEGSEINIANKSGKDRTLSGVKAAEKDNEAVNKEQFDKGLKDLSDTLLSDSSSVVLYDKTKDDQIDYTNVTFGKGKDAAPVALHNVAAGSIAENSTDVINGGQVHILSTDVAKFLGGDAEFKDGAFKGPTYNLSSIDKDGAVEDKPHTDVGSAFKGLDDNIKNVNARIKEVSEGVAQDSLSWSKDEGAFVALHGEKGGEKTNSKITSLADGTIASGSSDAVNGGQIYSLNQTLAKYFGGETKYENDEWSEPTFTLKTYNADGTEGDPQEHHNVTEAFAGIDKNVQNIVKDFNDKVTNITESVQGDALLWSDDAGAFVAKHGEKDGEKTNSKITSLADGTIASGSSDAVNGGQIYSLNQSLAKYFGGDAKYADGEWSLPGFKIMTFQEDGSFEEEDYDSIAAAFAGVNKVFKNLHNEISDNIEQNALLWSDDAGAFVALHGEKDGEKTNSKITFLSEGKISEDSTDAINGGQIYTLKQTFASYFGGGAGYDKEGNWQAPKFYVQSFNDDGTKGDKEERESVSEAFDVVNDSMSTINDRIKEVEKDVASNGLNWNEEEGSYDASHADDQGVKRPSKIVNVEDGKVDKDSKDAVNGGQLWETQQMITDQVKDIETKVTEGSVQYDKDETGKKTNKVTLVGGDESSPVLINNVADGKIENGSKEAVNGGQLHDYTEQQMKTVLEDAKKYTDEQVSHLVKDGVSEANSYTDMKFEMLNYAVEDVRKEARQAAAVGLAVSGLRYSDIPGKLTIAFGTGLWRSQSAFAFGAGYTSESGDIGSNLSITTSGGHWGISAGVNVILN
ncbi:YadA-like family protein [Bartonella grahamii]|uniref:YadA-like family protein n=1 Tax=Bartonella grahamii TaxID=33045 RepID=UPI002E7C0302|nr:YadA-like family protein [Bartonella grahamii]